LSRAPGSSTSGEEEEEKTFCLVTCLLPLPSLLLPLPSLLKSYALQVSRLRNSRSRLRNSRSLLPLCSVSFDTDFISLLVDTHTHTHTHTHTCVCVYIYAASAASTQVLSREHILPQELSPVKQGGWLGTNSEKSVWSVLTASVNYVEVNPKP
jgi:hypothetical protein